MVRLMMEYVWLWPLLLMLAHEEQGTELSVSLLGIRPGYEFICLVFAISSKIEDQKFLVIKISEYLDSEYSILQRHVSLFFSYGDVWKSVESCRPPPPQKSKFQRVHLGLMESWVRTHETMKTAWDLRSNFSLISSCVVLGKSLKFSESSFPFRFVNHKAIYTFYQVFL